jgi:heme/copper-type cytochrome/quinol oxidase subunit 1
MQVRARAVATIVLAIALLVTAGVLWAGETEFGWFAYAPLADEPAPYAHVLTPRRDLALGVGGVGLLVLGFAAGLTWGRRSSRTSA